MGIFFGNIFIKSHIQLAAIPSGYVQLSMYIVTHGAMLKDNNFTFYVKLKYRFYRHKKM